MSARVTTSSSVDATVDSFEQYRIELTGYCYRMLGSAFDAEDAVQETMTRAWRSFDRFEGRSSIRTWLYTIAHNVCLDSLNARKRRARPMDLSEAYSYDAPPGEPVSGDIWIEPVPEQRVVASGGDPADTVVARESIRLAFMAALQALPPRQRAVLILRDVLRWQASEAAELLDTTVASANSALQRARATLAARGEGVTTVAKEPDEALLARYVQAFEHYDIDSLTALIAEDATQSMPPYALWLQGRDDILRWWVGPGAECRGSRLVPTTANGRVAFGQYRPSGPGGSYRPWALQVLEVEEGRVVDLSFFLDTDRLFPMFGLPPTLE